MRSLWLIIALIAFSGTAAASDTGLAGTNRQSFRPTVDGEGVFSVDGSRTLAPLQVHSGFYMDYNRRSLFTVNPARGGAVTDLIKNQIAADFIGAVGVLPFLSVGIDVPVSLFQDGTRCNNAACTSQSPYQGTAFGDIRLDLKAKILQDRPGRVGLGFILRNGFPTGSRRHFNGGGTGSYESRLIVDKTWGRYYLAMNVGYRFVGKTQVLATVLDDELVFGAGAAVSLPHSLKLKAEVSGSTVVSRAKSETTPIEILAGLEKNFLNDRLTATVAGGTRLIGGFSASEFRVVAGLSTRWGRKPSVEPASRSVVAVYFRFDDAKIPARYHSVLDQVALRYRETHKAILVSVGFADAYGDQNYNLLLSKRRGEAVRKALIKRGVPEWMIAIEAHGSDEALRERRNVKDYWKDRRVDIFEIPAKGKQ